MYQTVSNSSRNISSQIYQQCSKQTIFLTSEWLRSYSGLSSASCLLNFRFRLLFIREFAQEIEKKTWIRIDFFFGKRTTGTSNAGTRKRFANFSKRICFLIFFKLQAAQIVQVEPSLWICLSQTVRVRTLCILSIAFWRRIFRSVRELRYQAFRIQKKTFSILFIICTLFPAAHSVNSVQISDRPIVIDWNPSHSKDSKSKKILTQNFWAKLITFTNLTTLSL